MKIDSHPLSLIVYLFCQKKLKKFKLKALYSLHIAFYGFTKEETQHMKEVTIENGGQSVSDLNDPLCTHIVINDQEIKAIPSLSSASGSSSGDDLIGIASDSAGNVTPTGKLAMSTQTFINVNMSPFNNTRASIVRAEWFWASIQICCRASECLYEFTKPKAESNNVTAKQNFQDPPTKRIKLSSDNLLSDSIINGKEGATNKSNHNSPHHSHISQQRNSSQFYSTTHQTPTLSALDISGNNHNNSHAGEPKLKSTNNLLTSAVNTSAANLGYESPTLVPGNSRMSADGGRRLNNVSNNNLSTSASLLDATTDDAMSSKLLVTLVLFCYMCHVT